jgi:hypothetical protein
MTLPDKPKKLDPLQKALAEQQKENANKVPETKETAQTVIVPQEPKPPTTQEIKEQIELINAQIKLEEVKKLRELPEVLKKMQEALNKKEQELNEWSQSIAVRELAVKELEEDIEDKRNEANRYYAERLKAANNIVAKKQSEPVKKIKETDYTRWR